jgi:glycosyltransferase involved in cell wall biosynthesis
MGESPLHPTPMKIAARKIRALSELPLGHLGGDRRPLNVCVVSSEFLGPVKNGGIGTATSGLTKQLVSDGHRVTLLYTFVGYGKPISGDKPWQHWVDALAAEGIVLERIPHDGDYRAWREASWLVKDFLAQADFDLVYFNDHCGSGYYSLLAKRAGFAPFCDQLHCVITHGSMEWVFNLNDYYARLLTDVEWMGLERRTVELADVVIAPSTYLLREYESYGWRLPVQTFHQPYPIFQNHIDIDYSRRVPIGEIVFFGRLEVRKGLWLFCEALDRLADRFPETDVTFLGRVTDFSGISSALQIVNRSARWPFRVRLLSNFDQQQALSYLRAPGKLAVMPSLADNSPCAVYECMESGIPFVSSRGSGADELIDPSCWDDLMVPPNVDSLTEKLASILEHGARLGRPRFDPAENLATWSAWHSFVGENRSKLLEGSSVVPSATQGTALEDNKAALIVIIDSGSCTVSLLIENLSSHMKRFGGRAAYLILSTRGSDLQEVLSEIFSGPPEMPAPPICIFDSRMIEEAHRLIAASTFVFFVDAETEILTSFFMSAVKKLVQEERTVVSCAVAVRQHRDEIGEIGELPIGDIPGLAALGQPIGGAVWAVTAASLAKELSSLELYDQQMDALVPALTLGQCLMERCHLTDIPVHVLPIVGAMETREDGVMRQRHTLNEARRSAASLGIVPSVYKGGAPWFAISALGAGIDVSGPAPIACVDLLQREHPLFSLLTHSEEAASGGSDLPLLAAGLGRPELSLQLEAGKGPLPGRVRLLTDLAIRSMRSRPYPNLAHSLSGENVVEFGLKPMPTLSRRGKHSARSRGRLTQDKRLDSHASSAASNEGVSCLDEAVGNLHVYVDARRLRIRRNVIEATANLRKGGPGKVFLFDVPLLGNSWLTAELRSSISSDPIFVRMKALDQRAGDEMGIAGTRLAAGKSIKLSIPLHEVFARAAILLEFSGARKMEVTVEEISLW